MSPSHSSDNGFEGSFSNEGSNAGDIYKYETQAPSFQTGFGFSSPSSESSRDVFNEEISHHNVNTYSDAHSKSVADQVPHSQVISFIISVLDFLLTEVAGVPYYAVPWE